MTACQAPSRRSPPRSTQVFGRPTVSTSKSADISQFSSLDQLGDGPQDS